MVIINSVSTFINMYRSGASIQDRIRVIKQLYSGNSLPLYKERYIEDKVLQQNFVDWKKRYESSNYMNLMVDEFLEFVPYMNKITGISSTSDRTIERKEKLFDKWLDKINWKSMIKNIGKERKLAGDVYIHWYIKEDKDGFVYPKFKKLDSENMTHKVNEDEEIEAYVWETSVEWDDRVDNSNANYIKRTKNVKWEFMRGVTYIYENNIKVDTIYSDPKYEDEFQLIHLQYLREENSTYSTIPCESLIDGCLRMDKIETGISTTNMISGSPTLVVVNGEVGVNSGFGQNGILYINQTDSEKKVQWGQLEITNGLKSRLVEWENVLNQLYKRANLVQPKLLETLATTDSNKVVSSIRVNLENEIEDLFLEVQKKFKLPLKILFQENDELAKKDDLMFNIPDILINISKWDEYLLRSQQMALGIKTVQDNLRDEGFTVEQSNKKIREHNEEQYGGKDDISINKTSSNTKDVKQNVEGLDNNLK